jgi:glycosyltransferase involved in cell wall biosynthesis
MNEIVLDGVNGLCVDSVPWGTAGSGIPAFDPDFDQLTAAIERLGDDDERARLAAGAVRMREGERSWERTVEGLAGLIERVS